MNFIKYFALIHCHFCLFYESNQIKSTTPRVEQSLSEIANQICLEKTGYQPLDTNAFFRVVETPEFGNITLPCSYCGEQGGEVPKIWFWKKREVGVEERELEVGLSPNLTENRIYTLPDNSLTIQLVTTNDTGFYYCRSLMECDLSEFHFSLDVVRSEIPITQEERDDDVFLEEPNNNAIKKANEELYKTDKGELVKDLDKVSVKITSELDPWLPCDGCAGIRKRYAKCRIRTKLNKAKYPDLAEDNLNDLQKLLLRSTVLSCHSLNLEQWFPTIYKITSLLPNYLRIQKCQDACFKENRMLHEAKYQLDLRMDVGSSMSFICPDSDFRTKVVWRKDGSLMRPIGATVEPPKKKKTIRLPFEKKSEFNFKHAFVDRMNVLQLCYVGYRETAVYTCYMNNMPVKSFNITVVTAEETLKERRYHFWLLSIYTCIISGAIVVIGSTWAILRRRELFYEVVRHA